MILRTLRSALLILLLPVFQSSKSAAADPVETGDTNFNGDCNVGKRCI